MLFTRNVCWHHICLRDVNALTGYGGVVVNSFKLALHLPVVATQENDVVGMSNTGHMGFDSNLNPWITLQDLTKNPIENVIEEGRGECASLLNSGVNHKGLGVSTT